MNRDSNRAEKSSDDGFQPFRSGDGVGGLSVRVRHPSPKLEQFLRETGAEAVVIAPGWEGRGSGLAFLAMFKDQLRRLTIATDAIDDLAVVTQLANLEEVSLECSVEAVDFSQLRGLRKCLLGHPATLGNIGSCTSLRELALFELRTPDLAALRSLRGLRRLHLNSLPRLKSLAGLETLALEEVRLAYLTRLSSVGALAGLRTLKVLEVFGCKHVSDFSRVGEIHSLKELRIMSGPKLESFGLLERLSMLTELGLWNTEVGTARVSIEPLTRLKKLRVLKLLSGIKNATDLERLGELSSLEILMLGRGPELRSLAFLRGLENLQELSIVRTRIADGDLSVLLELPKLQRVHGIGPRLGHYSHSVEEINTLLRARHGQDFESPGSANALDEVAKLLAPFEGGSSEEGVARHSYGLQTGGGARNLATKAITEAVQAEAAARGLSGPFELKVRVDGNDYTVIGRIVRGRARVEIVAPQ